MAKGRPQPVFMFTTQKGEEYTLHVHMTESRRRNHQIRLYYPDWGLSPQNIYVQDAKTHALSGRLREIRVYGSLMADNGKVYADLEPTVLTYDVSSGEYGWDVMMDRIRQLVREHRSQKQPDFSEQPPTGEVQPTPGMTELEW